MYSRTDILLGYSKVQLKYDFQYTLKDQQIDYIFFLSNKHHLLSILPTGFGKSEICILLPLILNELDSSNAHISFVIVPLISLIDDLIFRLSYIAAT